MTGPILLALLLAQAPAARTYVLDAAPSTIRFHLHHPLHSVDGRVTKLEAKALVAPDGELKVMVRAPVASFDTGDGNRDSNLRAVMETDRHPYVVLKGTTRLVVPAAAAGAVDLKLAATLDVHGVSRPMEIPVKVTFGDRGAAHVEGSFPVSLEAHRIERPSLLFKKVDDAAQVQVDLYFRPENG